MTLESPLGPIDYVARDLNRWPRNAKPPTIDVSRLRGMTVHWAGGPIASYYRGTVIEGDEALIGDTIESHNARPGLTDVGYQLLLGRSGRLYEGRGLASMNGANGDLLKSARPQFPLGTKSSNPFFVSVFVCAGTSTGFTDLTAPQRLALARTYSLIVEFYGIKNPIVNGHRDVRATACPGDTIWKQLPDIAARWPLPSTCKVSNPAHPEWSCWPANKSKPTIGAGSSGDAVAYLHGVLRAWGYSVPTTAVWATATGTAVAGVQKSNGLAPDRIVGKSTWDVVDVMATKAK